MHARLLLAGLAAVGLAVGAAQAQTGGTTSSQRAPLPNRPTDTTSGVGGPTGTRNALGNGQTIGAGMTGTGVRDQGNLPAQPGPRYPPPRT